MSDSVEPAEPLPANFESLVRQEIEREVSDDVLDILEAHVDEWKKILFDLLDEAEDGLDAVRDIKGPHRAQVMADFTDEIDLIDAALTRLMGPPPEPVAPPPPPTPAPEPELEPETPVLQLSWASGRLVAWSGAARAEPESLDLVMEKLEAAGAPAGPWQQHADLQIPGGFTAPSVEAPIADVLGWLVAIGGEPVPASSPGAGADGADADSSDNDSSDEDADTVADTGTDRSPSVRWLSRVAVLAVEQSATGRMVPQVQRSKKAKGASKKGDGARFEVRWVPSLIHPDQLSGLAAALPGTVTALGSGPDPRTIAQSVVSDMVDAICRTAAEKLEVPAPPPKPKTKQDVAEAVLANLDGTPFDAPPRLGAETMRRLEQWGRPVTGGTKLQLVVQLDPPDSGGAWHLAVLAPGADDELEPVEVALVTASNTRRKEVQHHLSRLERILPVLLRPGADRRGQVILSQDEAWELMTETGETVAAAGFDVRVPELSRKRKGPALRLTADNAEDTVVGAQQLADVRWSAVFDDVELDAKQIADLAAQARPLVKSRGKWVALDHADLAEAAAVLAEASKTKKLTGAEMLRHALGLEGPSLSGGVSLAGEGWAADLLASAAAVPDTASGLVEGFDGELRSYQAEAVTWLGFLDGAGLGGCLALDMGLGKTPTVLARVRATMGNGPSLVIAPPAVVGNWASEAARFTPDLKVVVHHGASRSSGTKLTRSVEAADLVITTYGTAVRDMDALVAFDWDRVVLDEAQVIKNPASETAQQLRRLQARSRLALTGTPIENGLGDLWSILDFTNPGLVGARNPFVAQLSASTKTKPNPDEPQQFSGPETALRALNGILVFRRTKAEPAIAAELPDRIDELDHCAMTPEQIGLYQAVLDSLVVEDEDKPARKGAVLAAITALKQICNHPANYQSDDPEPLAGRSGKLTRLEEIAAAVFAANERMLVFTHFASWGERLAAHLTEVFDQPIQCYHGGLARGARDRMVEEFQNGEGPGALVLSLKAGGTGLNLTAASHVVLYDRWWNPAVEDQARDRVWRIGQTKTVVCHRLVCPGTVDERVEEVVAGKRRIADMVLPKSSSLGDLDAEQLQVALGLDADLLLTEDPETTTSEAAVGEAGEPGESNHIGEPGEAESSLSADTAEAGDQPMEVGA
jgi:hypothetical protein